MRFLINNKFKKSVPFEMRDIIERKIIDLLQIYLNTFQI